MKRGVIGILLLSAATLGAQGQGQGRGGRGGGQGNGGGAGINTGQPNGFGRWVRLAPGPELNEERSRVVAHGKLCARGGNPVGLTGKPAGSVWEYDPTADKWAKKKDMPMAAHHLAVTES